ncbi:MAG TPA: hypothetical protein VI730_11425, partial [Burkholderiales bacterium]|nr:hypothetical protein [Burkholderiales bacterium]
MAKPAEPRLCSTREYARLRGISRQRVLALLDAGRIAGARWIGARFSQAITRAAKRSGRSRGRLRWVASAAYAAAGAGSARRGASCTAMTLRIFSSALA